MLGGAALGLFDGLPLPAWVVDAETSRILEVNDAAVARYGYGRDELVGASLALLEARSEPPGGTGTSRHVRKDGSVIEVEVASRSAVLDGRSVRIVMTLDMTGRRPSEAHEVKADDSARRTARDWSTTFDTIPSIIVLTDLTGAVRRLNRAARDVAGAESYTTLLGARLDDVAPGEPWLRAAQLVRLALQSGLTHSAQVCDDLAGRSWDLTVTPQLESGRIAVVAHDVTDLVKLRDSLARNETMAAIGGLVAGVAHEVRNPLFGISSTLYAFEARFTDRPELLKFIEVLRKEADRLSCLMRELLDYARPATLEMSAARLGDVVSSAIENCRNVATRSSVSIELAPSQPLPPMLLDRARLAQVIQNLVENAVQHSPRGGVVRVTVRPAQGSGSRSAEVVVEDDGPGIRPEDLPRVFQPFFTRRRGGTGLGLSIVQRMVERHGGTIVAANRAQGGAEMTVRIPLTEAEERC